MNKATVGDLVIVWRAAVLAPAYYLAIVTEAPCTCHGYKYKVRPLMGWFRFQRTIESDTFITPLKHIPFYHPEER